MKSIIAAGLLLGCAHGAYAAPYMNVEANSGFLGNEYGGSIIDAHIGIEGEGWYVQAGPAILAPDGADSEMEFSGKVGGSAPIGDLDIYGEVSFMTGDETSYGTKAGVKYTF